MLKHRHTLLKVKSFTFNPIQENTYIVYDETKSCVIIDPGCYDAQEKQELKSFIETNELTPVHLINTHCHIDHVLGNAFVKLTFGLPLQIHPKAVEELRAVKIYASNYGLPLYEEADPDAFFEEGDQIKFGNTVLDILFVPGHSPGSVAFVEKVSKTVMAGDVLFFRSIGRSDLPGGNAQTLIHSIRTKLFTLDDDYKVYPGHGKPTTIGEEKKLNPYLN